MSYPQGIKISGSTAQSISQSITQLGIEQSYEQYNLDVQKQQALNNAAYQRYLGKSYEKILKDNPHYIPFQRVMDEQFPNVVTPRSKFSGAKSNIKSIKGSEREIKDPFESILRNTYDILDAL